MCSVRALGFSHDFCSGMTHRDMPDRRARTHTYNHTYNHTLDVDSANYFVHCTTRLDPQPALHFNAFPRVSSGRDVFASQSSWRTSDPTEVGTRAIEMVLR